MGKFKLQSFSIFIIIVLCLSFQSCKEKAQPKTEEPIQDVASEADGFTPIFDGKSLNGWDADTTHWRVENGNLVGEVTPTTLLKTNNFIIWKGGQPADFELKLEFRIAEAGNSGINYRSERLDTIPFALRGYQADIDGKNSYTGQNYEERKRATLAYRGEKASISSQDNSKEPGSLSANVQGNAWQSREILASLGNIDSLKTKIKSEDWNDCHLIIKGNRLQHYINGILMSDVIDNDTVNRKSSGYLGLQAHVGPPMKVEYRNILLKSL
tara:strand:- start:5887 stop:6693 length:807 start_codon:yes stop_codon:yes gene_type:complete